jgi:hypothetical protein
LGIVSEDLKQIRVLEYDDNSCSINNWNKRDENPT